MKRNGDSLKQLKDYWQGEKVRKLEMMKTEPGGSEFIMQETRKIDTIISALDKFWLFICRESTGHYDKLIENDAALLVEEIGKAMTTQTGCSDEAFVAPGTTRPQSNRTTNQNGARSVYVEENNGTLIIN